MNSASFQLLELLPHSPPFQHSLVEGLGLRGLHCGSGLNLRAGWLNTDQMRLLDRLGNATCCDRLTCLEGNLYYLEHDATQPWPLEGGCFDWVYSEHFLEHLTPEQAVAWLREARRLLRPEGYVRLSTPDLRRYLMGYFDPEGRFFADHRRRLLAMGMKKVPDRPAWMVNQIFRLWGHQWIYDLNEIRYLALQAGFAPGSVTECRFRQGQVLEVSDLDLPVRNDESLYVEIQRT